MSHALCSSLPLCQRDRIARRAAEIAISLSMPALSYQARADRARDMFAATCLPYVRPGSTPAAQRAKTTSRASECAALWALAWLEGCETPEAVAAAESLLRDAFAAQDAVEADLAELPPVRFMPPKAVCTISV